MPRVQDYTWVGLGKEVRAQRGRDWGCRGAAASQKEATDALQLLAGSCCLFSPHFPTQIAWSPGTKEPLLLSLQALLATNGFQKPQDTCHEPSMLSSPCCHPLGWARTLASGKLTRKLLASTHFLLLPPASPEFCFVLPSLSGGF